MTTYSAFFSSGLLAPRVTRCPTPALSSSSMAIPTSPVDPVDRQLSLTPTPASPRAKAPEAPTNAERPALRRRRSSINIGANPMALIKSPIKNAGAALQRAGFMSPTRSRAASVTTNEASENNSLFGRLRSGSVSSIANAPKRLRRAIRRPVPITPAPNMPLPALPPRSPTLKCGSPLLPSAILVPLPRQHYTTKTSSAGDVGNLYSPALPSPTLSGTSCMSFDMPPGLCGSRHAVIDEAMVED